MPERREHGRRIAPDVGVARRIVHRRRTGQERTHVHAEQGAGQQADRRGDRSSAADPIPHREGAHPLLLPGAGVQQRAWRGDRDRARREREALLLHRAFDLEHAVASLRRAARLADDDDQRVVQRAEALELQVGALGGGVVEHAQRHRRLGPPEHVGEQHRAKRAAADAAQHDLGERAALGRGDAAAVHGLHERLDAGDRSGDRVLEFGLGREPRSTQPEVADHALLVLVGHRACFEPLHRPECFGQRRRQPLDFRLGQRSVRQVEFDERVVEHAAEAEILREAIGS